MSWIDDLLSARESIIHMNVRLGIVLRKIYNDVTVSPPNGANIQLQRRTTKLKRQKKRKREKKKNEIFVNFVE